MSIFNWQANDGDTIVSSYIRIYFVVAILLTLLALVVRILWLTWAQRRYSKKRENDIEIVNPKSK
jgi:hypothetical protein